MIGLGPNFAVELVHEGNGYLQYAGNIGNYPISFERHEDWLTNAYWALPDEYGLKDFLRVVEGSFQAAEDNGYEAEDHLQL